MKNKIALVPLNKEWVEPVFSLGLSTYGEEENTPQETVSDISELHFGEHGYYMKVITVGEKFVGYLAFYEEDSDTLIIGDIVVKQKFRGKKVAQQSIARLLEEVSQIKKYKKVILTVRESNESAIKCYQKLNFNQIKVTSNYYTDKESAVEMELLLC